MLFFFVAVIGLCCLLCVVVLWFCVFDVCLMYGCVCLSVSCYGVMWCCLFAYAYLCVIYVIRCSVVVVVCLMYAFFFCV